MVVERPAVADLLDHAVAHHGDAVRHGQRFALVVRDVDEGDSDAALDRAQFVAHVLAQLEVERRQWLVEQQHLRFDRQCARDRHALLLAAGEFVDPLVPLPAQRDQIEQVFDRRGALGARHAAHTQAVGDVVGHRHVRKQCQVLEDERGRPVVRADAGHVLPVDADVTGGRFDESRDGPQKSRLPAAGRAEEGEELAGGYIEAGVSRPR